MVEPKPEFDVRFEYSVARFVPDQVRGEFVNIGVIVGSDESGEWAFQQTGSLSKANHLDEFHILPEVLRHLATIGVQLDKIAETRLHALPPPGADPLTEEWLHRLARDSANVLQFSTPQPIMAASGEAAIDLLAKMFLVEKKGPESPPATKLTAMAAVD